MPLGAQVGSKRIDHGAAALTLSVPTLTGAVDGKLGGGDLGWLC
jgi:hypothetical protein